MIISEDLLKILVCPKCKGDIELSEKLAGLICGKCCLFYEIRDGIPIMIIEKAKKI